MVKLHKNFITKEESELILDNLDDYNSGQVSSMRCWLEGKIVDKLSEDFHFKVSEMSSYTIDITENGTVEDTWASSGRRSHPESPWHQDMDGDGIMQVGSSLLIRKPKSGGNISFGDDMYGSNKVTIDRDLYDLACWTGDEWHMVDPNSGNRVVFLLHI
jgi:hypothetical protein